jgi:hypothetical protein
MEPKTPDYFSTLLPIITLMIGVILNAGIEYLRDGRVLKREQKARKIRREEAIASNRIEFQRETLLKLQDAINEVGRQTAKLHIHDLKHLKTTGNWQEAVLPPEVDEADRAALSTVSILYVRVQDKDIKALVDEFRTDHNNTLKSVNSVVAEQAFAKMQNTFVRLNEKIGDQILNLDNKIMDLIGD